eukprot:scaffold112175_cov33-Tisochrysis_lutea.AAC.6
MIVARVPRVLACRQRWLKILSILLEVSPARRRRSLISGRWLLMRRVHKQRLSREIPAVRRAAAGHGAPTSLK